MIGTYTALKQRKESTGSMSSSSIPQMTTGNNYFSYLQTIFSEPQRYQSIMRLRTRLVISVCSLVWIHASFSTCMFPPHPGVQNITFTPTSRLHDKMSSEMQMGIIHRSLQMVRSMGEIEGTGDIDAVRRPSGSRPDRSNRH